MYVKLIDFLIEHFPPSDFHKSNESLYHKNHATEAMGIRYNMLDKFVSQGGEINTETGEIRIKPSYCGNAYVSKFTG